MIPALFFLVQTKIVVTRPPPTFRLLHQPFPRYPLSIIARFAGWYENPRTYRTGPRYAGSHPGHYRAGLRRGGSRTAPVTNPARFREGASQSAPTCLTTPCPPPDPGGEYVGQLDALPTDLFLPAGKNHDVLS
jgi:hypothetical protein